VPLTDSDPVLSVRVSVVLRARPPGQGTFLPLVGEEHFQDPLQTVFLVAPTKEI
jgi:hypothetical protein